MQKITGNPWFTGAALEQDHDDGQEKSQVFNPWFGNTHGRWGDWLGYLQPTLCQRRA
jgi:hypothetical protein